MWNLQEEQLEMDTGMCRCDIVKRLCDYSLSVKHTQSSNFC